MKQTTKMQKKTIFRRKIISIEYSRILAWIVIKNKFSFLTHRSASPGANRSYGGNRPYSRRFEASHRDRSPNYRQEREASYSSERDRRRSQSKSPERSFDCWNCGEFHQGGASTCTVCLICGNSNHPTRECKNKKKHMPSKRGVNVLVEGRMDECDESENFL